MVCFCAAFLFWFVFLSSSPVSCAEPQDDDLDPLARWFRIYGSNSATRIKPSDVWCGSKFNTDLAQLSEKEVALLRAIAQGDHDEFNPAPFVQKFPHQYFKRLAEKGLLIRAGRGRYKLHDPLFRQFLQQGMHRSLRLRLLSTG